MERLLGLGEGLGPHGHRDCTILDVVSWASDPGGDYLSVARVLQVEAEGTPWWMAKRGPLAPDSDWAIVLYDFEQAMKKLPLFPQVIVALTVMGFGPSEIAQVLDPDAIIDLDDPHLPQKEYGERLRKLGARRQRIARIVEGRPRIGPNGQPLRDVAGDVVYSGGIAKRLSKLMNEGTSG